MTDLSCVSIVQENKCRPFAPERDGKIVLLKHNDDDFIVLAPLEFCHLHAQIVDRFCQLRKLTIRTTGARVDPISESWIISGGCLFQASDTLRTLGVLESQKRMAACISRIYVERFKPAIFLAATR